MVFHAAGSVPTPRILSGFGDERITVTDRILLRNGRPYIPVMGEIHFSRVPREKWAETLRKMKEGGLDIAASYLFWIHHEEEKGRFDFTGNRDIRAFIQLCHETGLEFCLRIGPWAHGECRNGGFPDWLVQECGSTLRSGEEPYMTYVSRYIRAVADQIRGLPLFGIQIENEMTNKPEYMEALRRMVLDTGLTAPLLTATGWGHARLPDTLLPMFGGYPEAPWTGHTRPLEPNPNCFFSGFRDDADIGGDLENGISKGGSAPVFPTPFMSCELGGGNQVTYHRRPLFQASDIENLLLCKLGSGMNLVGYYMYAGGLNPVGQTTMQESRASGYPTDCPVISYDFQAPVGDMGQMRESWFRLKYRHRFLHSFGEMLAPMIPVFPTEMPSSLNDEGTLRCALRSDGKSGFLFVNNHVRLKKLPPHPGERFTIDFAEESVSFSLDIPGDCAFILPVNLTVGDLRITAASAEPLEIAENSLTLTEIPGMKPVLILPDNSSPEGRIVALRPGAIFIEGTMVTLLPREAWTPSPLARISAEPVSLSCDPALLMGHLPLPECLNEYSVRWQDGDKWLVIRAVGNLGGFYVNGTLLTDAYLYGDSWVIDLRKLKEREGRILIQSFTEEDRGKVYLEVPFEPGAHEPEVYVCREDMLRI